MDIVDLSEFYASRLGIVTRRALSARLKPMLTGLGGAKVAGLGYAVPFLADCVTDAEAEFAFMLARQGVFGWPDGAAVRSALVDECELPLLESAIDVALIVHGLEFSDAPAEMLKEIWRGYSRLRAGSFSLFPIAAVCGPASIAHLSAMASRFPGRKLHRFCAKAGSRSPPGHMRFTFLPAHGRSLRQPGFSRLPVQL